jgi:hypothetical protein
MLVKDNKSAILLEKNTRRSFSKRTRHLNSRYFFVMDQVVRDKVCIEYCPTGEMVVESMIKPSQEKLPSRLKRLAKITWLNMGLQLSSPDTIKHGRECVRGRHILREVPFD